MSLWIRSQDKEMLINCYTIEISLESDKCICSNGYVLGTYSTKEKALKVLDMIQNAILIDYIVFQMPDDEDVE